MCAPFPLGGAARGAPRTDVVRRTSAHTCAPPKGVAWGGAEGGCARGHGSSPSWAGGGAVWGGVPPLGAATQIHAETPCLHLLQRTSRSSPSGRRNTMNGSLSSLGGWARANQSCATIRMIPLSLSMQRMNEFFMFLESDSDRGKGRKVRCRRLAAVSGSADVGELPAWCFSSRLRRRTAGAAPLCHLTVDRQSALERLGNGPTPPRDLLHARWPV